MFSKVRKECVACFAVLSTNNYSVSSSSSSSAPLTAAWGGIGDPKMISKRSRRKMQALNSQKFRDRCLVDDLNKTFHANAVKVFHFVSKKPWQIEASDQYNCGMYWYRAARHLFQRVASDRHSEVISTVVNALRMDGDRTSLGELNKMCSSFLSD